jgi:hypothetical protein
MSSSTLLGTQNRENVLQKIVNIEQKIPTAKLEGILKINKQLFNNIIHQPTMGHTKGPKK